MNYQSGKLSFTKSEKEAMKVMLWHCKKDISYGGGGSFTGGDNENSEDIKEIKKAQKGVEIIEQMLVWLEM